MQAGVLLTKWLRRKGIILPDYMAVHPRRVHVNPAQIETSQLLVPAQLCLDQLDVACCRECEVDTRQRADGGCGKLRPPCGCDSVAIMAAPMDQFMRFRFEGSFRMV